MPENGPDHVLHYQAIQNSTFFHMKEGFCVTNTRKLSRICKSFVLFEKKFVSGYRNELLGWPFILGPNTLVTVPESQIKYLGSISGSSP